MRLASFFHIRLLRCEPDFLLPGGRWRASSGLRGSPLSPEDTCQHSVFLHKPARLTAGLVILPADHLSIGLISIVVLLQSFS
jgi:hypothetical protein